MSEMVLACVSNVDQHNAHKLQLTTCKWITGTNGMGISIGKIQLYVGGGGFHPEHSLPACLDCGTNTKQYLDDKFYLVQTLLCCEMVSCPLLRGKA